MKSPDLLEGCENFRCEIFRIKFLIYLLCSLRTKKGSPRASLHCYLRVHNSARLCRFAQRRTSPTVHLFCNNDSYFTIFLPSCIYTPLAGGATEALLFSLTPNSQQSTHIVIVEQRMVVTMDIYRIFV